MSLRSKVWKAKGGETETNSKRVKTDSKQDATKQSDKSQSTVKNMKIAQVIDTKTEDPAIKENLKQSDWSLSSKRKKNRTSGDKAAIEKEQLTKEVTPEDDSWDPFKNAKPPVGNKGAPPRGRRRKRGFRGNYKMSLPSKVWKAKGGEAQTNSKRVKTDSKQDATKQSDKSQSTVKNMKIAQVIDTKTEDPAIKENLKQSDWSLSSKRKKNRTSGDKAAIEKEQLTQEVTPEDDSWDPFKNAKPPVGNKGAPPRGRRRKRGFRGNYKMSLRSKVWKAKGGEAQTNSKRVKTDSKQDATKQSDKSQSTVKNMKIAQVIDTKTEDPAIKENLKQSTGYYEMGYATSTTREGVQSNMNVGNFVRTDNTSPVQASSISQQSTGYYEMGYATSTTREGVQSNMNVGNFVRTDNTSPVQASSISQQSTGYYEMEYATSTTRERVQYNMNVGNFVRTDNTSPVQASSISQQSTGYYEMEYVTSTTIERVQYNMNVGNFVRTDNTSPVQASSISQQSTGYYEMGYVASTTRERVQYNMNVGNFVRTDNTSPVQASSISQQSTGYYEMGYATSTTRERVQSNMNVGNFVRTDNTSPVQASSISQQSYENQGFHYATPPPINLGSQNSGMGPGGGYTQHLFIPAMTPHHNTTTLMHQPIHQSTEESYLTNVRTEAQFLARFDRLVESDDDEHSWHNEQ